MNTVIRYEITLEGNDIDTKKVQKLKPGSPLVIKRVNDEEDTFEICIYHSDGREIDMLSYPHSIGVAPFMDAGLVTASATVGDVTVKPGKSRAKDLTVLTVNVEYIHEDIPVFTGKNGFGFLREEDIVLTLATINVLSGDKDILISRPYLNLYTMELDVDQKGKEYFEGFEEEQDLVLQVKALFDETFTKCRITAVLTDRRGNEKEVVELEEEEKQTVLTFVNHRRIFDGEEGVNREIEG